MRVTSKYGKRTALRKQCKTEARQSGWCEAANRNHRLVSCDKQACTHQYSIGEQTTIPLHCTHWQEIS